MLLQEKVENTINNAFKYNITDRIDLSGVKKVEILLVDVYDHHNGTYDYRIIGENSHKKIDDKFKKELGMVIERIDKELDSLDYFSFDTQSLILTFDNNKVLTINSSEWLNLSLS